MNFTGEFCVIGQTPKRIADDHVERYRFAAQFVPGKRVLDLACGTGYGSRILADAGAKEVMGVDLSEEVVSYARKTFGMERVTFAMGDICTFKTAQPFDVITCFETIEHVENFSGALGNLKGLLGSSGLLLISSPNRIITSPKAHSLNSKPNNPYHKQEFAIPELHEALRLQGFVLEGTYGQRQRRLFQNAILRKLHTAIFKPNKRSSPEVKPVNDLVPRYFLMVARVPK